MSEDLPTYAISTARAPAPHGAAEIAALWRTMRERRDMRHFLPGTRLPEGCLERLVEAAHLAPSVGFMQPWRFIRITSPEQRQALHAH